MALKSNNLTSVKYHAIFDYILTKSDLFKWQYKNERISIKGIKSIKSEVRLQRERCSQQKLKIAKRAAVLISKISTVKFVGVTGSLAMMNSNRDSDIDLMIITKKDCLWTTRLLVYYTLYAKRYTLRKPRSDNERDALCLNMWLDESDLVWDKKDRNIYTAHEIAQIVPLVNKNKTYEKFLYLNRWILNFWPNSLKMRFSFAIENCKFIGNCKLEIGIFMTLIEKIAHFIQYQYMRNKITREIISPTRAIFHPNDWGKKVLTKLKAID